MRKLLALLLLLSACNPAHAFIPMGRKHASNVVADAGAQYAEYSGCTTRASSNTNVFTSCTEDLNVGGQISHSSDGTNGDSWSVSNTAVYLLSMGQVGDRANTILAERATISNSLATTAIDMRARLSENDTQPKAHNMGSIVNLESSNLLYLFSDAAILFASPNIHRLNLVKLNTTSWERYDSGTDTASGATELRTGWSQQESNNSFLTLNTDAVNGDDFTVDSDGIYAISLNAISGAIGGTSLALAPIYVGPSKTGGVGTELRAYDSNQVNGQDRFKSSTWIGPVLTSDLIYLGGGTLSGSANTYDAQLFIAKLTSTLDYARFDSGNSVGSTNDQVITGYTLRQSSGASVILTTDATNGDRFSVASDGRYAISVTVSGDDVADDIDIISLNIGAAVVNTLDTATQVAKKEGRTFFLGAFVRQNIFWVQDLTTSDLIWVMNEDTTGPRTESNVNQITIVRLDDAV